MKTRLAALFMAVLLAFYMLLVLQFAIALIAAPQELAKVLGVALIVLPLVGLWALGAELLFAFRGERLARRLESEGALPTEQLPLLPSGRVDPDAADQVFPQYKSAVEAAPRDWRTWFRLALAYDASGDRRRARWATRQAIRVSRDTNLGTP